jgi:flagellar hook-basal body complex protein FliE
MAGPVGAAEAAALYRSASTPSTAGAPGGAMAGEGGGFNAALQRALQDGVELGRSADASATQALAGQGSISDVVLAVSRAELALQTAVAVRDRVVAAYQDVMRMPI